MKDFYASLAGQGSCPNRLTAPAGPVSGFVDGCTAWSARGNNEKNDARRCYIKHVDGKSGLALPTDLHLDTAFSNLPNASWLGFEVAFTLATPWYSKDDRPFHVMDNPVRKDRVFGVPFMAAASWKGLVRWAFRMGAGLAGPEPEQNAERKRKALAQERHLFGNEKGSSQDFTRGALAFYPTWFDRIGFEVINPHSRKTRAGTQPIYYEVVPPGTTGTLRLLYAPVPGAAERDGVDARETLVRLLDAVEKLLTLYGFSAKRTAGWGSATTQEWRVVRSGDRKAGSLSEVTAALGQLLAAGGTTR